MIKCIYVLHVALCRIPYAINFVNLRKFKLCKFLEIKPGMFAYKSIFGKTWTIVHGLKGNFDHFRRQTKWSKISQTKEPTPTKISLHAFQVNLYLHGFFEPILFFDPHGLFLKANKMD